MTDISIARRAPLDGGLTMTIGGSAIPIGLYFLLFLSISGCWQPPPSYISEGSSSGEAMHYVDVRAEAHGVALPTRARVAENSPEFFVFDYYSSPEQESAGEKWGRVTVNKRTGDILLARSDGTQRQIPGNK